jgi:hypothetical protein
MTPAHHTFAVSAGPRGRCTQRLVFVNISALVLGLIGGWSFAVVVPLGGAPPGVGKSLSARLPLEQAAQVSGARLKAAKDNIAEWFNTCLADWDAQTHMTKVQWTATCRRVSVEREKFLLVDVRFTRER